MEHNSRKCKKERKKTLKEYPGRRAGTVSVPQPVLDSSLIPREPFSAFLIQNIKSAVTKPSDLLLKVPTNVAQEHCAGSLQSN